MITIFSTVVLFGIWGVSLVVAFDFEDSLTSSSIGKVGTDKSLKLTVLDGRTPLEVLLETRGFEGGDLVCCRLSVLRVVRSRLSEPRGLEGGDLACGVLSILCAARFSVLFR